MNQFDGIACPECWTLTMTQPKPPTQIGDKMVGHLECLCGYRGRISVDINYWDPNRTQRRTGTRKPRT